MIDYFCVLTTGGITLFSKSYGVTIRGTPIDNLISTVILEHRTGDDIFKDGNYALLWSLNNERGLMFVAIYNKNIIKIADFARRLLDEVNKRFSRLYKELTEESAFPVPPSVFQQKFDPTYDEIFKACESLSASSSGLTSGSGSDAPSKPAPRVPRPFKKEERFSSKPQKEKKSGKGKGKGKEGRVWDDDDALGDESEFNRGPSSSSSLSSSSSSSLSSSSTTQQQLNISSKDFNIDDNSSFFNGDEDEDEDSSYEGSGRGGFLGSLFSGLSGRVLSHTELQPILQQFKQHLEEKNVASEVAQSLCESVVGTLAGRRLGTFASTTATVREALEQALTRILTPSRSVDMLRDIQAFRRQRPGKPYSVVFMGANGVGKSTNLAKIGSWLRTFGYRIMFAACDTFRSGAVEQLKTHSQRLGIELFEQGYGKDDTAIAASAIEHAEKNGIDVVLIDTAGRMQDKEPLMRAISKLVNTVQPNLVLYVGEALVGNEAVDQLTRFNQALRNVGPEIETPRGIDGIVLTKFDTVDDKVGSAVTMVYTTHVPIVFLGTGQHYTDIKKLQVSTVVRTLLK